MKTKQLIIAEKPSVAADIAKALGDFENMKDYYENDDYIVTWSVGHIVELFEPEDYDKKNKFWALSNLPIIPDEFKFKPIEATKTRFNAIKKLVKRNDVSSIVNACDAGREGELIFREILFLIPSKDRELRRLWLSAMTKDEITKQFKQLKSSDEFDNLGASAFARTEADWLVGINATRAFTRRWGTLLSIGRVQTPTLNIICEREREIRAFKPQDYFELEGKFVKESSTYLGTYVNSKGDTKIMEESLARELKRKLKGETGVVTNISNKTVKTQPPLLFDLTELQREANRALGYTAQRTLNIAQSLYEKRKLITYPRTDSRYLPASLKGNLKKTLEGLNIEPYSEFVEAILKSPLRITPRIINDKGVSDHYAIIPTGEKANIGHLTKEEANLFDMITKRFIAVFMDDSVTEKLAFDTVVKNEVFRTNLSRIKSPGWMAVYGHASQEDFVKVKNGDKAELGEITVVAKQTAPPPRFTDATILSAMENAGKFVEDEELKETLKEKGIGTPATRAAIIERLIEVGYIERLWKSLVPTDKGIRLIDLMSSVEVNELLSPALTGEWEAKLISIEKGKYKPETFLKGISKLTTVIVDKVKNYKGELSVNSGSSEPVGTCPKCNGKVYETAKGYVCENVESKKCDFILWKKLINRQITRDMAEALLRGETVHIDKLLSRYKKYFSADIKLEDGKVAFIFPEAVKDEILDRTPIAKCPNCDGNIVEGKETYFCDNEICKFKMKKVMGGRVITREELKGIIEKGKSPLLTGFKSKKGRSFSAYLFLDKSGIVKFEFEKRTKSKTRK
ncbi:MAG: DNA topoisomerase 3 [Caldisericaceae bacterium]